jgi:uncharacterized protein (DUF1810 family)
MDTQYNLERFVEAQAPVYRKVVAELAAGRKATHWMWFIFPQIAGLGHSAMAQKRLRECSALVLAIDDKEAGDIFDPPDDRKFHSSMTLFAEVAPHEAVFQDNINKYFDGVPDQATIDRL